ncbi:hypothetical protein NS212_20695 [Pseudomonas parafulva]|nr:hypothetical protein NS212_20695 [Pseudomonas parafulva]
MTALPHLIGPGIWPAIVLKPPFNETVAHPVTTRRFRRDEGPIEPSVIDVVDRVAFTVSEGIDTACPERTDFIGTDEPHQNRTISPATHAQEIQPRQCICQLTIE